MISDALIAALLVALVAMACRLRKAERRAEGNPQTLRKAERRAEGNPYARWLGKSCIVEVDNRIYLATCVAVGWHGSVAVRGKTVRTRKTIWISRHRVAERVRWLDD